MLHEDIASAKKKKKKKIIREIILGRTFWVYVANYI